MQKQFLALLFLVGLWAISGLPFSLGFAAVKDQSRLGAVPTQKKPSEPTSLIPDGLLDKKPNTDSNAPLPSTPQSTPTSPPIQEPVEPDEEFNVEDIPAIERVELTLDLAKRAISAFAQVGTKYDDKGLNDYPTLKEFVEKTDAGKALQKEIQQHGFKDISEWNTAIMNVNFAYGALIEDPTHGVQDQIKEVRESTTIPDDKKLRIIASLNALIPPKSNIEIIRQLNMLPEYRKKLNLLNPSE